MQRIEEYNQLLEDSKEVLRKDTTLWKGFLKFATQFTHYQFFDQILIYVQNPKATACATFDQWKKIGRYVRKGEHSIVLLDETGKRGKLRHIFDVTATGPDQEFEYRPKPILPEQREELARKLNAAYSRENSAYAADSARWDGDLEHTLSQIALSMTQEYYNLSPDQAAAQSESTEIPAYYIATATSAMYLLLEKYGFSQEAESLDFSCIKTKDQLNLPVPEVETKTIVAQPSELQKKMVAELSERAAAVHNGAVDPTIDNMLKITSDGRKIGLDQRLMNPLLSDDTASKVNLCVGNVLRIWEEGKEKRLTQLIFCDNSVPKPNTFNIYDDVKGKLIAAGIPEMEIAYIHDADTEIKKKNLFSKVNDGQVRILLGSTQKMGAGTNVQERLIAIHHLDVGWRPADMIQRNGRIIRQGNRNPVVQVYNYVTEGTFDSYLWQTLENKQKFISQIMTSKSPVRSCEDVDEQVLTYAEVKALCAGDDRIKEKMDLEVDIARLRMLKAEHQSMQYRLEDQLLKTFPEQIREKEGIIQKLDADIKTTEQYPPFAENTIFLEILGKVYTDQKEAAKAFLEAGKTCKDTRSIRIGSYRGFELEGYVNVITAEIQIAVKGKLSHPFELSDVPALNLKRLDSALNKLPERMILERGKLEALYQQREDAQKQLNTPFPQEDELREKTKRLEELAVELDVDAGREPQENEDNEKTTMKISKPTGIRQSRFSRFRRQKDEKEEDADEDIDF